MDLKGTVWTTKGHDIERSPYGVPTADLGSLMFIYRELSSKGLTMLQKTILYVFRLSAHCLDADVRRFLLPGSHIIFLNPG